MARFREQEPVPKKNGFFIFAAVDESTTGRLMKHVPQTREDNNQHEDTRKRQE
jgi:hypothetical protein